MRIVEMLGSIRDCELFQNSAIRSILEDLASGGSKPSTVVRAELNKSLQGLDEHGKPATKEQIGKRIDLLLDQAVEAKVFRIGLVFQCYFQALKLRSDRSVGRPQTITEWLMKATIIQTLGQEFARKHYIWI
jgi:hypothetical protein